MQRVTSVEDCRLQTMKKNNEKLLFEIAQLRQDKIIYAVESCAVSLVGILLVLLLSARFITSFIATSFVGIYGLFAFLYLLFMGITNLQRLKKIKRLELELE